MFVLLRKLWRNNKGGAANDSLSLLMPAWLSLLLLNSRVALAHIIPARMNGATHATIIITRYASNRIQNKKRQQRQRIGEWWPVITRAGIPGSRRWKMEEPHQDGITHGEGGKKNCQDDREAITGKKNKKNNNTHGGPLSHSLFLFFGVENF